MLQRLWVMVVLVCLVGGCINEPCREPLGEKPGSAAAWTPIEQPPVVFAKVAVKHLRCEYRANPLGIDVARPRLSWQLASEKRGCIQTAYRILAATTPDRVVSGKADLWDSGKMLSRQSTHVAYAGKPLASRAACYWKVMVWNEADRPSLWSETAHWTMGLLEPENWQARWIGIDGKTPAELAASPEAEKMSLAGCQWIWFPEGKPQNAAPCGDRYFRRVVTVPDGRAIDKVLWLGAGDNSYFLFVNGKKAGSGQSFKVATYADVTDHFKPGQNVVAVVVSNVGDSDNPAGLLGVLEVRFKDGDPLVVKTDARWKAAQQEEAGWQAGTFDDTGWKAAMVLGEVGMAPWGEVSAKPPEDRTLAARMLRREFSLAKPVKAAHAMISGLGLYELYLNGQKVGDRVLDPAMTEYTKHVFYVTHDVTSLLKQGGNCAGVILGSGRYYAPRLMVPTKTRTFGFPKMILELHVTYADGTTDTLVSDTRWKMTARGPIRDNNEYDGEIYDARMEMPGWDCAGYDDSDWLAAQAVSEPGGRLVAQMCEPIRVIETLKPVAMTNPKPGVYVFDLGQNMVGWPTLTVKGPRGTEVTLACAETLNDEGLLYKDNLRSAKARDIYILKGEGVETYAPRFTYHGFRYVSLSGYPGTPDINTVTGCVVHDDMAPAGGFQCSHALLNRIYENIRWGLKGNYRSVPTDCPQRDEKQGWLGDRSIESHGETYFFDVAAFYSKWLDDIRDAQTDEGSVPDVAPSYWPFYSNNVTWPSSYIIIPGHLHRQYGDLKVIERHYPTMKKWITFMEQFIAGDLMPRDQYGDWCVPPASKNAIHSNDPAKKTAKEILGTTYFYYDLMLMGHYAGLLGKTDEAKGFRDLAARLKAALNRKYFKPDLHQYDNGSQTSSILPLAFGLVPEGQVKPVFDRLVNKIVNETDSHVGTGLIGCQWLMRVLSDHGRPDLAFKIATQKTYPSWGYMVENGATTIWELWNGNTANPAMNSGNHVMLVGDLAIWLHEYLAGIRTSPESPGFQQVVIKPVPVEGLTWVKGAHRSLYGEIKSHWENRKDGFILNVTVPANSSAHVFVPGKAPESVSEGGQSPASRSEGVELLRVEDDYVVFKVSAGTFTFRAPPCTF